MNTSFDKLGNKEDINMAEQVNLSAIFNDTLNNASEAVSSINNMYQQAQNTFTSRREIAPPPQFQQIQGAPQNPYWNVPDPNQQQSPWAPPAQYASTNSYGYGYSNGSTVGFSYTPQQEIGYPGFTNQVYGKQGGF